MNKIIFLAGLATLFIYSGSMAMDWKDLHNQADRLTLTAAKDALIKDPDSVSGQYVLALVYLNLHQDRDAENIFIRLLKDNPNLIQAQWGRAEVLRRRHETLAAQEKLNNLINADPRFAPALISLAYIKYFQMDYSSSASLASQVIQQGRDKTDLSNYVRALAMYAGAKGMLAHYGGLFSKAIDGLAVKTNLDKAQKLQPDSPAVLFGLGSFYLLAPPIAGGDRAKAEIFLKQAVKADPLFADAYVRFAQLAKSNGDQKQYEFYLQKALEIDPQNELALDVLSRRCKFICIDSKN